MYKIEARYNNKTVTLESEYSTEEQAREAIQQYAKKYPTVQFRIINSSGGQTTGRGYRPPFATFKFGRL